MKLNRGSATPVREEESVTVMAPSIKKKPLLEKEKEKEKKIHGSSGALDPDEILGSFFPNNPKISLIALGGCVIFSSFVGLWAVGVFSSAAPTVPVAPPKTPSHQVTGSTPPPRLPSTMQPSPDKLVSAQSAGLPVSQEEPEEDGSEKSSTTDGDSDSGDEAASQPEGEDESSTTISKEDDGEKREDNVGSSGSRSTDQVKTSGEEEDEQDVKGSEETKGLRQDDFSNDDGDTGTQQQKTSAGEDQKVEDDSRGEANEQEPKKLDESKDEKEDGKPDDDVESDDSKSSGTHQSKTPSGDESGKDESGGESNLKAFLKSDTSKVGREDDSSIDDGEAKTTGAQQSKTSSGEDEKDEEGKLGEQGSKKAEESSGGARQSKTSSKEDAKGEAGHGAVETSEQEPEKSEEPKPPKEDDKSNDIRNESKSPGTLQSKTSSEAKERDDDSKGNSNQQEPKKSDESTGVRQSVAGKDADDEPKSLGSQWPNGKKLDGKVETSEQQPKKSDESVGNEDDQTVDVGDKSTSPDAERSKMISMEGKSQATELELKSADKDKRPEQKSGSVGGSKTSSKKGDADGGVVMQSEPQKEEEQEEHRDVGDKSKDHDAERPKTSSEEEGIDFGHKAVVPKSAVSAAEKPSDKSGETQETSMSSKEMGGNAIADAKNGMGNSEDKPLTPIRSDVRTDADVTDKSRLPVALAPAYKSLSNGADAAGTKDKGPAASASDSTPSIILT
jgi:hypothetical protein